MSRESDQDNVATPHDHQADGKVTDTLYRSLSGIYQGDTIEILETLPDGQERVLESCSHQALIVYLETDQAIQDGPR